VEKFDFDRESFDRLKQAGWSAKRTVDTTLYLLDWQKDGYSVFSKALKFTQSFGGIRLVHRAYGVNTLDQSHFDSSAATRRFNRKWAVDVYEGLAQEALIPVGQGYSEHLTYLLGNKGGLYGGYDDYFCRIGRTVEEAVSNIIFAHQFEELSD
jgi:hypothetical protein